MHNAIDTPLEELGACIFLALWAVCFFSCIYGTWELVATFRLIPSAFGRGRRVLSVARALPHPGGGTLAAERITTATGQFRFMSATECLFSPRFLLGFQIPTGFPLKGRIRFSGSHAHVECRAPHGLFVALAAWILAMPILPVLRYIEGKASLVSTLGLTGGEVGLALGLVGLSLLIELRRAHRILGEIEAHLRARLLTNGCSRLPE